MRRCEQKNRWKVYFVRDKASRERARALKRMELLIGNVGNIETGRINDWHYYSYIIKLAMLQPFRSSSFARWLIWHSRIVDPGRFDSFSLVSATTMMLTRETCQLINGALGCNGGCPPSTMQLRCRLLRPQLRSVDRFATVQHRPVQPRWKPRERERSGRRSSRAAYNGFAKWRDGEVGVSFRPVNVVSAIFRPVSSAETIHDEFAIATFQFASLHTTHVRNAVYSLSPRICILGNGI